MPTQPWTHHRIETELAQAGEQLRHTGHQHDRARTAFTAAARKASAAGASIRDIGRAAGTPKSTVHRSLTHP